MIDQPLQKVNRDIAIAPFKLCIIIHGGSNLPVADFTASDPYVLLFINKKSIGQTTVVKRNLNPEWNQMFQVNLLHRNLYLQLKIMDEDVGKDPDPMGIVRINLSEITTNKEVRMNYKLEKLGKLEPRGHLDITLILGTNDKTVSIIGDEEATINKKKTSFERIRRHLRDFHATEAIQTTVQRFWTEDKSIFFSGSLLKDLLKDACSLQVGCETILNINTLHKYHHLHLVNSTLMRFDRSHYHYRHAPLEENSIQLNLSEDELSFVLLKCPNRYSMWTWVKWLRLLHNVWLGRLSEKNLPHWAQDRKMVGNLEGIIVSGRNYHVLAAGRYGLSVTAPFKIGEVQDQSTSVPTSNIPLEPLISMVVSWDSVVPHPYIFQMDLLDLSVTGDHIPSSQSTDHKTTNSASNQASEHGIIHSSNHGNGPLGFGVLKHVTSAVKGLGKTAVNVATGTGGLVSDTVRGAATNTTNAAVAIVTANPTALLAVGVDSVLSVALTAHDMAAILANAPLKAFLERYSYIVIKCGNVLFNSKHQTGKNFAINEKWSQDISLENMSHRRDLSFSSNRPDAFLTENDPLETLDKRNNISFERHDEHVHRLDHSNLSIDVYLCHGVNEEQEVIIAQKHVKLNSLYENKLMFNEENCGSNDPAMKTLILDSNIELIVTILEAKNIPISNLKNYYNMSLTGSIYAKAKLVNISGKSSNRIDSDHQTKLIELSPNPMWNETFLFKAEQGICKANYVRIELLVGNCLRTDVSVGAVFIPVEYFKTTRTSHEFDINRYRHKAINLSGTEGSGSFGLGNVSVTIEKKVSTTDLKSALSYRSSVKEQSIFDSMYYCECIPKDNLLSSSLVTATFAKKNVELFVVSVGFDALILDDNTVGDSVTHPNEYGNANNEHSAKGSSRDFSDDALALVRSGEEDSLRTDNVLSGKTDENTSVILDIEVFENERRSPFFPFDWSPKSIISQRPRFSDLNYIKADSRFNPYTDDGPPPDGFEWEGKWTIDKTHATTDKSGWIYGLAFRVLLSNYKIQKFDPSPFGNHCRRRKWVRKARLTSNPLVRRGSLTISTTADQLDWRKGLMESASNRGSSIIVGTCKEREGSFMPVTIPWDRVYSASLVSSSVLSVCFQVQRYLLFKAPVNGMNGRFEPLDIEMFISNCPAVELKSLIDERIGCNGIRSHLKELLVSGYIGDEEPSSDESEDVMQESPLSEGSMLLKALDHEVILLRKKMEELRAMLTSSSSVEIQSELHILERRECRFSLYMAALLGADLKSNSSFSIQTIDDIMNRDLDRSARIGNPKGEVAAVNDRIQFLIECAEKHILESALCGWNKFQSDEDWKTCLQKVINRYLIEITGLLGVYFEDGELQSIKGLEGKMDLLKTFIAHHSRLSDILKSALGPYGLKAEPQPYLSLFLKFDKLAVWYSNALYEDMKNTVNKVIEQAKRGGNELIPWIAEETPPFTHIPEDTADFLNLYLKEARINQKTLEESFRPAIGELDARLCLSFSSSFLNLGQIFEKNVQNTDWTTLHDVDRTEDYFRWIFSVAIDSQRVIQNRLLASVGKDSELLANVKKQSENPNAVNYSLTKYDETTDNAYQKFFDVTVQCMDHLSCYIMKLFQPNCMMFDVMSIYKKWFDSANSKEMQPSVFQTIVKDFRDEINPFLYQLTPQCLSILSIICAEKLQVLYLGLLNQLKNMRHVLNESHRSLVKEDLCSISSFVQNALNTFGLPFTAWNEESHEVLLPTMSLVDRIRFEKDQFGLMGKAEVLSRYIDTLLFDNLKSQEMVQLLEQFENAAKKTDSHIAIGLANFVETMFALRGLTKFLPPSQAVETIAPSIARRSSQLTNHHMLASHVPNFGSQNDEDQETVAQEEETAFELFQMWLMECVAKIRNPHGSPVVQPDNGRSRRMSMETSSQSDLKHENVAFHVEELIHVPPIHRVFAPIFREISIEQHMKDSVFPQHLIKSSSALNHSGKTAGHTSILPHFFKRESHSSADASFNLSTKNLSVRGKLLIHQIKLKHLIHIDLFKSPKPILEFKIHHDSITYDSNLTLEQSGDWQFSESAHSPSGTPFIVVRSDGSSSPVTLTITLLYKGYVSKSEIGTTSFEFNPIDQPNVVDKQFEFHFDSKSAQKAAEKVKEEGGVLPCLLLTAEYVKN